MAWIHASHLHPQSSDDAIIGLIVLIEAIDHLFIENVAVDPDCQGAGVGRALLEYAESYAVECGLSEVRLYTNEAMTENLNFYPSMGYREYDRHTDNDFHRVYCSKQLR